MARGKKRRFGHNAGIDWSNVNILGTMPDPEVARRLGIHPRSVFNARKRRGISSYRRGVDWERYAHLLGTMTDQALAKKLRLKPGTVNAARNARAIPAHGQQRFAAKRDWSDVGLGTATDREIAHAIGEKVGTVSAARQRLGISPYTRVRDWSGIALGTKTDADLAAEIGATASAVACARRRLGIKRYRGPRRPRKRIDWSRVPLGTDADVAIAKTIGVSGTLVAKARKERGISPYNKKRVEVFGRWLTRRQLLDFAASVGLRMNEATLYHRLVKNKEDPHEASFWRPLGKRRARGHMGSGKTL